MSPVLSDYEYDIFISYRHNDNRSGWVTEFVKSLQEELDATIKEPVSVYFDSSPHDGLLETHNVDKSLEGKLKCLIFIPILSQTYCDPKSFAWQHEFVAFNKLASGDNIGGDIKLNNGNVASRILPIKIHDLDKEDKATIEEEISGKLRALEFIYKEPGVNRPLKPSDNRNDNQNRTDYRNQVNKTANAIKEILAAFRSPSNKKIITSARTYESPTDEVKRSANKIVLWGTVGLAILFVLVYGFSKFFGSQEDEDRMDKSIAVLPFVDMTPNADREYMGDGIAEEIINSLTTIKDLKVTGRTSSFQFKGEKVDLREIGKKLNVGIVLEGSIQKYEDNYRITAQLVRTKDNFHIWSERFDLNQVNIFKIQDNIAAAVVKKLQLTLSSMEEKLVKKKEINEEAYNFFLKGLYKYKAQQFQECVDFEMKAIQFDSTYAPAYAYIGLSKAWQYIRTTQSRDSLLLKDAVRYSERAILLDPKQAEGYSSLGLISWYWKRDFAKAHYYFENSIESNPSSSLILNRYAYFLTWMGEFIKASQLALQAIQLDPADYNGYVILYNVAIYSGHVDEAAKYFREYKLLFGVNRIGFNNKLLLDFRQDFYMRVIQQMDSVMATGSTLEDSQLSLLARSYFKLNRKTESEIFLKDLLKMVRDSSPNANYQTALVYALKKDSDSCFHYLNLAANLNEPNFILLKIDPALQDIRSDPRYITLYHQNGYDKYP